MYKSNNGERTGWRDEAWSRRHREIGESICMVDIDKIVIGEEPEPLNSEPGFPCLEYSKRFGSVIGYALIEYKSYPGRIPPENDPNRQALAWLADGRNIPFAIAQYWQETFALRVYPGNEAALKWFKKPFQDFTERDFSRVLYRLRGKEAPMNILRTRNDILPPEIERRILS